MGPLLFGAKPTERFNSCTHRAIGGCVSLRAEVDQTIFMQAQMNKSQVSLDTCKLRSNFGLPVIARTAQETNHRHQSSARGRRQ